MAHPLDGLYDGLAIFILSTGTSLRRFDFTRLDGRVTIGINRVIEHYQPTILHLLDKTAHRSHAAALSGYDGLIIAAGDTDGKPGVVWRTRRVAKDARREAGHLAATARREARLAKAKVT